MKKIIIILIFVFLGVGLTNQAEAALSCQVRIGSCLAGETVVFKMSSTANAHAELSSQTNYNYFVCCSGVAGLGNSCSGNYDVALKLSGVTNAHVEKKTYTNYANNACLSAPSAIACDYSSDCSTLGSDYSCLASISGDTNAHVGNCNAYSTKVCCAVGGGTGGCQPHNVWGWAWSENIGWVSMSCANTMAAGTGIDYGTDIDFATGKFSGYAWSENIGWVSFNRAETGDPPAPPYKGGGFDYVAKVELSGPKKGEVSGWIRALAGKDFGTGGWDGWIKLRDTNYGVWIDTSVIPAEFRNWAWGGDDASSTAVVGWLSFNCKNQNWCATSSYKVLTLLSFNQPPSANNLSVDPPNSADYCGITGYPPLRLHWQFSDDPGDAQFAFEIEVFRVSDGVKVVDTGEKSGNTQEYLLNLPEERLEWNTSYNWRLMVWDNYDVPSSWVYPPSPFGSPTPSPGAFFTTSAHAWPYSTFTHSPKNPAVGQMVVFTDNSDCYSAPGNTEYDCKFGGADIQYEWDFDYINPTFTVDSTKKGNTTTTYSQAKTYEVRLKITDYSLSPPGVCIGKGDSPVGASLPLPKWKEVPPIIWLKKLLARVSDFFNF